MPVSAQQIDALIEAALHAPAPHHSRPWRYASVLSENAKSKLATAMGTAWRRDLEADHVPHTRIDTLVDASRRKLESAPAIVVACTTWDGLDRYPDVRRRQCEYSMALLSLGAALENLMLAATATGLGTGWFAAPLFCPDDVRTALALPNDWTPAAAVFVGHPDSSYSGRTRPPADLEEFRIIR